MDQKITKFKMSYYKSVFTVAEKYGKYWLKIFYHDCSEGDWFTTERQLYYINTKNMFSIFNMIDERFKIDEYYEFLLEYPTIPNKYNNWRQKVFPLDSTEYNNTDIGYYDYGMHIDWNETNWGGLRMSNYDLAFIDGTYYLSRCWFSIAAKKTYVEGELLFPGPSHEFDAGTTVSQVYLWVRIPHSILNQFFHYTCKHHFTLFIYSLLFTAIIIK